MATGRDAWSGVQSGGEAVGALCLRAGQCACRCSSLSTPPWRAMGPRLLLCCVADMLVGSCCGECQSIRVKLRVHVDVTIRSWMRALASLVSWVRSSPMRSTPSVALTAQHGIRTRFTGRLVIATGATASTSLLLFTAVGDCVWMRSCWSSMQLLRSAAPFHPTTVTVPSLRRVCDTRMLGETAGHREQLGQGGSPGGGADRVSSPTGTCRTQAQRGSARQQRRRVRRHQKPRIDERVEIR